MCDDIVTLDPQHFTGETMPSVGNLDHMKVGDFFRKYCHVLSRYQECLLKVWKASW